MFTIFLWHVDIYVKIFNGKGDIINLVIFPIIFEIAEDDSQYTSISGYATQLDPERV